MRSHVVAMLALAIAASVLVTGASASVTPYVRLDYGGSDLRMTDINDAVHHAQDVWHAAGYPIGLHDIGYGFGPGASAGVWLGSSLRLGATCAYQKATWGYHVNVPDLYVSDHFTFHVMEIGGEAALRFTRLHGLTVGADVARARADVREIYRIADALGSYQSNLDADRMRWTYGGFVGIDQTNASGVAGYVRAGFRWRDMGRMPATLNELADGERFVATGETRWMDFSGFYVKVGAGFDFVRGD